MAFKIRVAKLEDLEEGQRPHYKPASSTDPLGGFVVDLDDVEALPALAGLKANRDQIKNEKTLLSTRFAAFIPMTDTRITELATLASSGKPLVAADTWAAQETQLKTLFEDEKKTLVTENGVLKATVEKVLIESAVEEAGKGIMPNPKLALPFIRQSLDIRKAVDGKTLNVVVVAEDAEKTPRIGDTLGTPMSIKQRLLELAKNPEYKILFNPATAAGTIEERTTGQDAPPPTNSPTGDLPRTAAGKLDVTKMTDDQKSTYIDTHGFEKYRVDTGL